MSWFNNLKRVTGDKPPFILLYGPSGIGKTTLASEFPNGVFLQTELGENVDHDFSSGGLITTYDQIAEALGDLYNNDHDFKTLVVDSLTELHSIIVAETCARGDDEGKKYDLLENFPYGKGPVYALRIWEEFINALNMLRNDRGMTIICIAHCLIEEFKDPENPAYNRYAVALPATEKPRTNIRGMVERQVSDIFLMKRDVLIRADDKKGAAAKNDKTTDRVRATGGSTVLLHAIEKPAFTAKNRRNMPAQIRIDKGDGYAALAPYFTQNATQMNEAA